VDARHLESLRPRQRRKDPWKPAGEHRLAGSGRAQQQEVVRAGGRDLERTPRPLLTSQVREVGCGGAVDRGLVDRLEARCVDPPAEVLDDLVEMRHGDGLDPGQSGLGRRLGCTDESQQPCATRAFRDGQRPRDRADPPIQSQLADGGVLSQPLGRKLPRRGQHRKRDREVEARAFLPERGRCEVDGDALVQRPLELRRDDAASHAVLRLLAGSVGEADDGEARHARLQVRLDVDLARLQADECMGHRAREHRCTVPGRRSHRVTVFPERELQDRYGV
jgi:hypothetical protein